MMSYKSIASISHVSLQCVITSGYSSSLVESDIQFALN